MSSSDKTKSDRLAAMRLYQMRHAEAGAGYQIKQIDRDAFNAAQQIDEIIRDTPTSIGGKRYLKLQYSTQQLASLHQNQPLYRISAKLPRLRSILRDVTFDFEPWRSSLKLIEGRFGTAVVTYFVFLRWLLLLNICISVLVTCWIVVPQIILGPHYLPSNATESCEKDYINSIDECRAGQCLVDMLEGSGWMEQTILFQGVYVPYYVRYENLVEDQEISNAYNLPLAYLLTFVAIFIFSLLLMVAYTGTAIEQNFANSEDAYPVYSNKIFSGWDYRLTNVNTVLLKKESTHFELKSDLNEERRSIRRWNMTPSERLTLYTIRLILNLAVFVILAIAFGIIFYVTSFSTRYTSSGALSLHLVISYLPSITITVINAIIPLLFNVIVNYERYHPDLSIGITLLRTVFLKLASILVLFFALYPEVNCKDYERNQDCRFCETSEIWCWETAIGQALYRLFLTDFASTILKVFVLEYLRRLVTRCVNTPFVQNLGRMEFQILQNVLAIVYSQALCWIGMFYCPFLPLMTVVKLFVVFYLTKMSLLANMEPARKPFKASRAGIFFMATLIVTFLVSIIPVGYTIVSIEPSRSCSPFRMQEDGNYIWNELEQSLDMSESFIGEILDLIGSPLFCFAFITSLGLILYYYIAAGFAQLGIIKTLRKQLLSEGKDKRFLARRIERQSTVPVMH